MKTDHCPELPSANGSSDGEFISLNQFTSMSVQQLIEMPVHIDYSHSVILTKSMCGRMEMFLARVFRSIESREFFMRNRLLEMVSSRR